MKKEESRLEALHSKLQLFERVPRLFLEPANDKPAAVSTLLVCSNTESLISIAVK